MANEHHSNPYFSVISGVFGGVYAFVQTNGVLIESSFEFAKVVFFGLIGGACGYAGKIIATRVHNYLIKKAKEKCK